MRAGLKAIPLHSGRLNNPTLVFAGPDEQLA